MSITIAPSKNYPSPMNALPTKFNRSPPESDKMIALEIDWGTMGQSVAFNLADNSTLTFSQLVSMCIDNSQCGADVQFTFPDTADIVTIPAYSPRVIVPVFTNQLFFYAATIGGESEDITRVQLLNFVPPPIAVPVTQEQEAAIFNNVSIDANGTQQIIPAGISGTIEGVYITAQMTSSAGNAGFFIFEILDGNGTVIGGSQVATPIGSTTSQVALESSNLRVRFQNGLSIVWTSTALTGLSSVSINIYYRTP